MFNLPQKELEILKLWQEKNIFKKTLEKNSPKGDFVFYEGPPTANGKPGIHHIIARAFKDLIPRYKTMNGFKVERKAGWDTHGLPVELEVEKRLGLKNKKEVENFGIEKFNNECKKSVWQYKEEWEKMTERIGFWLDMENPYVTYDNNYIESLWWIIKQIYDKDLMYQGHKVIPQCPRCGTALSSHEVAQGYKNIKEESVYIKFKVKFNNLPLPLLRKEGTNDDVYILAWTTTPWTLPGNVALAVGADIEYVVVQIKRGTGAGTNNKEGIYILAKNRLETIFPRNTIPTDKKIDFYSGKMIEVREYNFDGNFANPSYFYKIIQSGIKGVSLVGLEYEPLFPGIISEKDNDYQNAFKVYAADFVSTEDGTGVVHTAVMYGVDDYELGEKVGLPKVHTVNLDGTFNELVPQWQGKFVKDVEKEITADLEKRGLLFNKELHAHDYPFCWRCDTPLIYYAKDSWFFKMSALREQLIKNNETINWVPEHIKQGRFGEWLKEAKDWAVSRERYWGTPLPVWRCQTGAELRGNEKSRNFESKVDLLSKAENQNGCGNIKVVGSFDELPVFRSLKNRYYLLRHGQAENNEQNILCGVLANDHYHLIENGKKQIENLIPYFKKEGIDLIIHSPFLRTTETAELVAEVLNLETEKNDLLSEVKMGIAEAKSDDWVEKNIGNLETRLKTGWPEGESIIDLRQRAENFLQETENKYDNKKILLVSHGDTIAALMAIALGKTDLEAWRNNYPEIASVHKFSKIFQKDGQKYFDPHRPFIDEIIFQCDKCGGEMRRVPEVMDCWFDSGAMPFAQWHYPFRLTRNYAEDYAELRGNEVLKKIPYPADFISEAIDQTRGWFYTLLAIATLLDKESPYKNVICLGHILDKNGQKMSKHIGNVVDPWLMIEKYGADVVRWYLYAANQPGEPKRFDESFLKESSRMFNTLFNVLTFYQTYVNDAANEKFEIIKLENILDKWVGAKLNLLIKEVTENLDNYDIFSAARKIEEFINELSVWYVRRSRDRFKGDDEADKNQAIFTLGKVLFELTKLLAPFTPFTAEYVYQELGKNCGTLKDSVHLEDWPVANEEVIDNKLLFKMEAARNAVRLGLSARALAGIKVKQPLSLLLLDVKDIHFQEDDLVEKSIIELIKDEVNVKGVKKISSNAEKLLKRERHIEDIDTVTSSGIIEGRYATDNDGTNYVALDLELTPELKQEGILRELVRAINNLRKEMKLTIQDKVMLEWQSDDALVSHIFSKFSEELKKSVLAEKISKTEEDLEKVKINEAEVGIKIVKC